MSKIAKVSDIAELAGVSTATVDRVLNQRPGVKAETVEKVRAAMEELGLTAPARGRPRKVANLRFSYILPAVRAPFFDLIDRSIAQSAAAFRDQHITETTHRLDMTDPAAFAAVLMGFNDHQGIALLAPDAPEIKSTVNELVRAGVHVVTLCSDIPGSLREAYVGMDNRAAGRTAGLLLGRLLSGREGARVAVLDSGSRFSDEVDRIVGFTQVIEDEFPALDPLRRTEFPAQEEAAAEAMRQLLAAEPRLAGVYNPGRTAHGVARAIAEEGRAKDVAYLGHDLTETNRLQLLSGASAFVLHQDIRYCVLAAARALKGLCENIRGPLAAPARIEILTRENLP